MIVLLLLGMLVLIAGTLIRLGHTEKTRARAEERRLRSAWLAESGLERAWAKLGADPNYAGETWALPAEALGGVDDARVLIRVEPVPDRPGARKVTARADLPSEGAQRARQTRTARMTVPTTTEPNPN